jgi:hypothetical protein
MYEILDLALINSAVLDITISSTSEMYDPEKMLESWEATSIKGTEMKL